jgi:hypothetical protein
MKTQMPLLEVVPPRHSNTGARKLPGFPAVLRHPEVSDAIDIAHCHCMIGECMHVDGVIDGDRKARNRREALDTDIHDDRV